MLTIGIIGEAPFLLKEEIKNNEFTAMIDSGSPVTIFTPKDLKEGLDTTVQFARFVLPYEKNVDFYQQPLDVVGFVHVHLKVGKQVLKRAQIMVTAKNRSFVGRD